VKQLSRKLFTIGHIYVDTFLLGMTNTMTSQNIDLYSRDPCMTFFDTLACNLQNKKEINNFPKILFRRNIFCKYQFFLLCAIREKYSGTQRHLTVTYMYHTEKSTLQFWNYFCCSQWLLVLNVPRFLDSHTSACLTTKLHMYINHFPVSGHQ
jgi:hypothetical protein